MATYGAVVPLMQDLRLLLSSFDRSFDQVCHYEEFSGIPEWKKYIQILYENVSLMDSLLRDSSCCYDPDLVKRFESRITDIVLRAGSSIYLDKNEFSRKRKYHLINESRGWEGINEEMGCINEELRSQKIITPRHSQEDDSTFIAGKSVILLNTPQRSQMNENKLVGLENDLVKMLGCLTGLPFKLQVFVITGMAGIGKTTFTRKLYADPLVRHHFYVRAWVTISQRYRVKEILLGLLSCITNLSDEMYECSPEQLRERVCQCLKGKRYLIILDDIWEEKDWNDLRMVFPDDKNGSRIILTSRLSNVAVNVSTNTPPHHMECLSEDDSWELLCSKVFVSQSCPQELIKVGKQISCRCRGLPLAIVVVGGLLLTMDKTLKVWEEVEQNVGSLVMKDAQYFENILALSYDNLPDPQKACFLYMGVFPEDYDIPARKLTWLWIAEGFILPVTGRMLEEVAEDYLEDLTARGLVMVKKRSNGRIKICCIHDLMRSLCMRISEKSNFLGIINSVRHLQSTTEYHRHEGDEAVLRHLPRISFHAGFFQHTYSGASLASFPFIRSCFCFETLICKARKGWKLTGFERLRVLDITSLHLHKLPEGISFLINLRYLALTIQESFCSLFFSQLHYLQTIILYSHWNGSLPVEFWKMLEIRHFRIKSSGLPFKSNSLPGISVPSGWKLYELNEPEQLTKSEKSDLHEWMDDSIDDLSTELLPNSSKIRVLPYSSKFSTLPNLLSLSTIRSTSCSKKEFRAMPNLLKLGVFETEDDKNHFGWFKNLVYLPELDTLKYTFSNPFVSNTLRPHRFPSSKIFPPKLLKLTLSGTSYPWEDMLILSILPKLQVLKLKNYAFSGAVWISGEGGFRSLRFMQIGSTNLEHWEANGSHFPSLQHLVLRHCRSLTEIPHDIAEAPLLEKIELHCCGESAVRSARQIQEEQQNLGNDLLTVYVTER